MRVDRNRSQFALLVLCRPPDSSHSGRWTKSLERRLRQTDRCGFLDDGAIGILLPDTDFWGAQTLAADLQSTLGTADHEVPLRIHTYPARPIADLETDQRAWPDQPDDANELFAQPLPLWKRMVDVLGATAGLIFAMPFLLLAAVAIKATSPGPVLFTQQRAGLGGRPFTIYKLRTMDRDAEARKAELRLFSEQDGPCFKMAADPRVTAVGRFLRRTCIDELPQLWNVLRGEMSLVGPRPLPCDEAAQCVGWQRRRFSVMPGLTCTWQVSGGMRVSFIEWMRMDLRYAASCRFQTDLALLWRTFVAVLRRRASC